jgi:hypothetical protein
MEEFLMNTKYFLLAGIFSLLVNCAAFADRPLDRAETLQILQKLTSQPKKTWIPAGTIKATHEEYKAPKTTNSDEINNQINKRMQDYQNDQKQELTEELRKMKLDAIPFNVRYDLSNEYTMNSAVVVRFDGDRFYWQIDVDSRMDSVEPDADLAGNFMTDRFDLSWNARRIFVWDGEKYTTYSLPGNNAIIDSTGRTPHVVNGPLTAGVIPWGYGFYTYEKLSSADFSSVEKIVDGQPQIHLTIDSGSGIQMSFVMDATKDYAVMSCSIKGRDNSITLEQYSNYQLVSKQWVPAAILIERYEAGSNRLLARDLWNITSIDANVPQADSFNVNYESDAMIEYYSAITDKPLIYRYSRTVDTDRLLAERLAVAASEGIQPQNCATVALKYAASRLGKNVTDRQLAQLVTGPGKTTSLYAMEQFVQKLGLFCRVVKTDIQTLRNLDGCEIILHIPRRNHFVVLGGIDNEYVWSIDLANSKFCYSTDLGSFSMDWTQRTALIISNQPLRLTAGNFTQIGNSRLRNMTAAGYVCTKLLQSYNVTFCSYVGGECLGQYKEYYERYGCESALSGSCSTSVMVRYKATPCIIDPYNLDSCAVTGEWTFYYMRACQ